MGEAAARAGNRERVLYLMVAVDSRGECDKKWKRGG
jgi:hypothetical protein